MYDTICVTIRTLRTKQGAFLRIIPLFALFSLFFGTGCGLREGLVKKSAPVQPDWLRRTKDPEDGVVFYVGRALAENVFDEKGAMDEALNNAAVQIARTLKTGVDEESVWRDHHQGDEVWGREYRNSEWTNTERVFIRSIVSGLRPVDSYWEKWWAKESSGSQRVYKYKYWVLVSFPEERLHYYQDVVKKNMRINGIY